jgi:hypothetical protein
MTRAEWPRQGDWRPGGRFDGLSGNWPREPKLYFLTSGPEEKEKKTSRRAWRLRPSEFLISAFEPGPRGRPRSRGTPPALVAFGGEDLFLSRAWPS